MSSNWCRMIATVTATGISAIPKSTPIGVPSTPQAMLTPSAISTANISHNSWRRATSLPRR